MRKKIYKPKEERIESLKQFLKKLETKYKKDEQ